MCHDVFEALTLAFKAQKRSIQMGIPSQSTAGMRQSVQELIEFTLLKILQIGWDLDQLEFWKI